MKHSTIIEHLCARLQEGYGLNTALAEISLSADHLADRLTAKDRVHLHQAYSVYRERLEHELIERSRLGRPTGALSHALRLARENPLILPGDDSDTHTPRASRAPIEKSPVVKIASAPVIPKTKSTSLLPRYIPLDTEDDDDDDWDEAETPPASPSQQPIPPVSGPPTPETVEKPTCSHLRAEETPPAALPPPPEPAPAPKLRWRRLFTGRAVATDETGKVVKSLMPGERGYHDLDFENHDQRSEQ